MWCRGLVVLCAVRVVSPDVGQLSTTTGVPVFPRSLEEATLRKPEDDPVTEAMSAEVGSQGTTTLSSVIYSTSASLSDVLLSGRDVPAETSSSTLHNKEEVVSPIAEGFGSENVQGTTSTVSPSPSTESSLRAHDTVSSSVEPAPEGVTSDGRYQKPLESLSSTTSPPVATRDHKTLDFNSSTNPSSGGQRSSSGDAPLAEPFSVTHSKDSPTQMDLMGRGAAFVGHPVPEAQGLVSSSPPEEGRENDSEDGDDYYDEDEEYEDDEDEADDDEEDDEDDDQDDDEDDAEDDADAEVQEDPERRAEVRSLSDLPLSKLLQVRGELRRLAGLTGLGEQDECATGNGVDAAQRSSSSSGSMSRTHPQAMALNWSGTRSSAKGDDAGSKGAPLRRGVWGWDEEEEEEENGWMGGWKSKKKKGKGDIGSVFQIAVTFLAFLAFGGYLLCLCITAIKGGGGYYYPTYGQLRPAPNVMMVMMAPTRLAPNRRPRPPATGKKRRRRSNPSGAESGEEPSGAWWSWAPWEDEPWEGPWASPDLGSLRADHMHRALLLLAEGYATYYHRKYNL